MPDRLLAFVKLNYCLGYELDTLNGKKVSLTNDKSCFNFSQGKNVNSLLFIIITDPACRVTRKLLL